MVLSASNHRHPLIISGEHLLLKATVMAVDTRVKLMTKVDLTDEELSLFLLSTTTRDTSLKVSSTEEAERSNLTVHYTMVSGRVV